MSFKDTVKGKKVLVFGLGLQGGGTGDALWLRSHGAQVRVTDQKSAEALSSALSTLPGIEAYVGGHRGEDIDWADIIIKNPGVPDTNSFLERARKVGKPVLTSIAVFVQETREKVVGITGTRGKSTTTELAYRVLDSAFPGKVVKGGNIPGTSGLGLFDQIEGKDYAVLELSSFQLHNFHDLHVSPHIAVVTNIYPDHLNRYGSMDEYIQDKRAISLYQQVEDIVIANRDNQGSGDIARSSPGRKVYFEAGDVPRGWELRIPGNHNRENVAAVGAVAHTLGIKIEHVKNIVENFHGLPFRMENRGSKKGITFINDTTSTTPTATIKAVKAMNGPTTIILGGETKNLPIDEMVEAVAMSEEIKKIIILGSEKNKDFVDTVTRSAPDKIAGQSATMTEAVSRAAEVSQAGWTVLLSPGFTSFDLFNNEFERGRAFNDAVERL